MERLRTASAVAFSQAFETVVFANTRQVWEPSMFDRVSESDTDALRWPFTYAQRAFDALRPGAWSDVLADSNAVMLGASDFTAPAGLGPGGYRRCFAILLRSDENVRRLFAAADVRKTGQSAWSWTTDLAEFGEQDRRPSTLYSSIVSDDTLLMCNSASQLEQAESQLKSAPSELNVKASTEEWAELRTAAFWMFRRYRHDVKDRTVASLHRVAPTAQTLSFSLSANAPIGTVTLHDDAQATAAAINAFMALKQLQWTPFASQSRGQWRTTVQFDGTDKSWQLAVDIVGWFGFTAYV